MAKTNLTKKQNTKNNHPNCLQLSPAALNLDAALGPTFYGVVVLGLRRSTQGGNPAAIALTKHTYLHSDNLMFVIQQTLFSLR